MDQDEIDVALFAASIFRDAKEMDSRRIDGTPATQLNPYEWVPEVQDPRGNTPVVQPYGDTIQAPKSRRLPPQRLGTTGDGIDFIQPPEDIRIAIEAQAQAQDPIQVPIEMPSVDSLESQINEQLNNLPQAEQAPNIETPEPKRIHNISDVSFAPPEPEPEPQMELNFNQMTVQSLKESYNRLKRIESQIKKVKDSIEKNIKDLT